jgi:hypothetical protein
VIFVHHGLEHFHTDSLLDQDLIRNRISLSCGPVISGQLREGTALLLEELEFQIGLKLFQSLSVLLNFGLDILRYQAHHNRIMHFEEVEVFHSGVLHVLTEAIDIDFTIAVKVKVARELVENVIVDGNTIIVKNIL